MLRITGELPYSYTFHTKSRSDIKQVIKTKILL